MFPHYLEFAGWLALAVACAAWIAMAVYLTMVVVAESGRARTQRARWIAVLWLLPVLGIATYLLARRAQSPRAMVGQSSGRSRDQ